MQKYAHPKSILAQIPYAVSGGEPLVVIEPPEGEGDARRNFTTQMRDTTAPADAPRLQSIEVRLIALFD